jgi:mono/diheme cytochrome c family protein
MNRFLKGVVLCSAVLFLLTAFFVPASVAFIDSQKRKSSASAAAKRVDELFNRNCARCHGGDGRGGTPLGNLYKAPDFTDVEWWKRNSTITSTRSLRSIVTRGKADMPAFGKKLTKTEINSLVRHVRSFRKRAAPREQ